MDLPNIQLPEFKLTARHALNLALLGAGLYLGFKVVNGMAAGAKDVGEAVGTALADVKMWLNGSHDIEATRAGFVLLNKYVYSDYSIDPVWRNAIAKANDGNAALFAQLLDVNGRIKEIYRSLVGNEVTAESFRGADGYY